MATQTVESNLTTAQIEQRRNALNNEIANLQRQYYAVGTGFHSPHVLPHSNSYGGARQEELRQAGDQIQSQMMNVMMQLQYLDTLIPNDPDGTEHRIDRDRTEDKGPDIRDPEGNQDLIGRELDEDGNIPEGSAGTPGNPNLPGLEDIINEDLREQERREMLQFQQQLLNQLAQQNQPAPIQGQAPQLPMGLGRSETQRRNVQSPGHRGRRDPIQTSTRGVLTPVTTGQTSLLGGSR